MNEALPKTAVLVFARGAEAETKSLFVDRRVAARLSELLWRRTLQTVGRLPSATDVVLAVEGALPASDVLASITATRQVHVIEQHGADFQSRMLSALEASRRLGYQRIVIVGIDTPSMSIGDLRHACESASPVIGPSRDGGFYLLGLNVDEIDRLQGLPWCTKTLVAALRLRLRDLAPGERPMRSDLDRVTDLRAQRADLQRLALSLLGRPLEDPCPAIVNDVSSGPRAWLIETRLGARGPPRCALLA